MTSTADSSWPPERVPPVLFRYLSAERAREALVSCELYFCSPSRFNDPFDCRIMPSFQGTPQDFKSVALRLARQQDPGASRQVRRAMVRSARAKLNQEFFADVYRTWQRELIDKSGILCLSENRDDILMWSHYAQGHTGVCMEFEYRLGQGFFGQAIPIRYALRIPDFSFMKIFAEVQRLPAGQRSDAMVEFGTLIFITKACQWAYEKEWRIIDFSVDGRHRDGLRKFPTEALTGVILGCQMPGDSKQEFIDLLAARFPQSVVYEAAKADVGFGLDIRRVVPGASLPRPS